MEIEYRFGVWAPPQGVWDTILEFIDDGNPYYHLEFLYTVMKLRSLKKWQRDVIWKAMGKHHPVVIQRRKDNTHTQLLNHFGIRRPHWWGHID